MLNKSRRVRTARDHQQLWRSGRVCRSRTLVARIGRSTYPESRFGFVVSKTVAKRAVVRNLIKRRLRALAREKTMTPPADIVLYATKAAAAATYQELARDLHQVLTNQPHAPTPYRRH